jgi:hypothetical protein
MFNIFKFTYHLYDVKLSNFLNFGASDSYMCNLDKCGVEYFDSNLSLLLIKMC